MAAQSSASKAALEADRGKLPRHLLTMVAVCTIAFLVVGMLRLTSRVTALELRIESLVATKQVERPSGPSREFLPADPMPARDRDVEPSARAARPQGRGLGGSSGAAAPANRPSGTGGAQVTEVESSRETLSRHPSPAQARANRQRIEQRMEDYVFEAQFDDETAMALEDEVERSFDAHMGIEQRVQSQGMSDQELREFLRSDLQTMVENVTDILGKEEGLEFVEEVLGVPERELEQVNIPHVDEEPPPDK